MKSYLEEVTHRTAALNIAADALRRAASAWCLAERDQKPMAFMRLTDAACAYYDARKAFRDWYSRTPLTKENTAPPKGDH